MARQSDRKSRDFAVAQRMLVAILGEAETDSFSRELCVVLQCQDALLVVFDEDTSVAPRWGAAVSAARRGEAFHEENVAAVPLTGLDAPIGAICVGGRQFVSTDIDRLTEIASFIGPLLQARSTITHRERELDAISVQMQQQSQVLDQIEDSVITTDLIGYITGWNGGAERLFGYTAQEAIGQNILFLYVDEDEGADDPFLSGGREMVVRRRKKSGKSSGRAWSFP